MKTHSFNPRNWLSRWTKTWHRADDQKNGPRRCRCEALESRQVLAADVVISEIYYQPPGNVTNERQYEYVELYNAGDAAINLRGWSLRTIVGTTETILYERPNTDLGSFNLPAGGYAIIAANINRYSSVGIDKKMGSTTNWAGTASLDNGGAAVILRDSALEEKARVDYLDEAPWTVFADGFGPSLRIIDPTRSAASRYAAGNWTASIERGGSPALPGLVSGPGVVFNELLTSSDNTIMELDQIELYNTTDSTIDLGGWFVTDDDNAAEGAVTGVQRYVFPAGTTIGPRGYLTIDESAFGAGANGFRLDGTAGEQVLLVKPGVGVLSSGVPNATYSDMVAFLPSEASVSYGRIPDGQGPLIPNETQTFGSENLGPKQSDLVITEVMYHPPTETATNHVLEYIEILNRGTTTVLLNDTPTSGWRLRKDVDFPDLDGVGVEPNFPPNSMLAPGERMVILNFDPATNLSTKTIFENHYSVQLNSGIGTNPIIKAYGGYLDNLPNGDGEIELQEKVIVGFTTPVPPAVPQPIYDYVQRELLQYSDGGDWPGRADGLGASLERIDPALYSNDPESWRGSFEYNGTPGTAPNPGKTVVINEILAHTDPPYYDSFELYNMSSQPVDISGWLVAEDVTPTALALGFVIPGGTILPAGGYITFNNNPAESAGGCELSNSCRHFPFGLDGAEGGNLYVLQRVSNQITRFADNIGYPASFNAGLSNTSLGRWPNGTGTMFPTLSITLKNSGQVPGPGQVYTDGANSGPRIGDIDRTFPVGDVVISEVMYNLGTVEGADSLEYVELYNPTNAPIDLGPLAEADSAQWPRPPQGWRLNRAVDYEFKAGEVIPAQGTILVVGFDPADSVKLASFRTRYGIAPTALVVGPFANGEHLSDSGGNIELEAPDFATATLPPTAKFTPNVLVDGVRYDDAAPWPAGADGGGRSLTRASMTSFGDFPASWMAAAPTPGTITSTPPSAPRVSQVVVWGDGWSENFRDEISSPGAVVSGYGIPSGATQSTILPWSGIDRVSVTFSVDVVVDPAALSVRGVNVPVYSVSSSASYDALTRTGTWQLPQAISRDRVVIDLDDLSVRDGQGNPLDGNWTDGTSSYPSGDGTAGGDFEMRFNVLPGDVDRNGVVEQDDFHDVRTAIFERVGTSGYDELRDVSGNGKITVLDWVLTRNQLEQSLPSGVPSPEAGQSAAAVVATRPTSATQNGRLTAVGIRTARRSGLATAGVDRALTSGVSDTSTEASVAPLRARASRSAQVIRHKATVGVSELPAAE
jgi:hypothetical protein